MKWASIGASLQQLNTEFLHFGGSRSMLLYQASKLKREKYKKILWDFPLKPGFFKLLCAFSYAGVVRIENGNCTWCSEKQGLGADLHLPCRLNPCLLPRVFIIPAWPEMRFSFQPRHLYCCGCYICPGQAENTSTGSSLRWWCCCLAGAGWPAALT